MGPPVDDATLERVLRWAMIERGSAELSDTIGAQYIVASPPSSFSPLNAAIAGRVVMLVRRRPSGTSKPPSSFHVLRQSITPGAVVLVRCEPGIGASFGSNIALQAAACRAQALVTDGKWRDTTRLHSVGIPVGSNGSDPTRPAGCPVVVSDSEEMFGTTWRTGDWFLRDSDGVLRLDDATARSAAEGLIANAGGELAALLEPTGKQ